MEKNKTAYIPTISAVLKDLIDVIVTSECIHLYILCIVPWYLFREVFVM